MPKILITGNGFDLYHGLPTSYTDMMEVLKIIEENEDVTIGDFINCKGNWGRIASDNKGFDISENGVQELRELILTSKWYWFFTQQFTINSWIDFENNIEFVLEGVLLSINSIDKSVLTGKMDNHSRNVEAENLDNKYWLLRVLLHFEILFDTEQSYKLNRRLLKEVLGQFIGFDISAVSSELEKELNLFKEVLVKYFVYFVFPLYKLDSYHSKSLIPDVFDYHFTFNYTPTFDIILNSEVKTRYIHGEIGEDGTSNIVLGVNDLNEKKGFKENFTVFTKYYQKLVNNTDYKFLHGLDFTHKTYRIFLFGHSLDSSDSVYIKQVFDVLKNPNGNIKIIIIYHSEKSRKNLIINLLNIIGEVEIQDYMKREVLELLMIGSRKLEREFNINISGGDFMPVSARG